MNSMALHPKIMLDRQQHPIPQPLTLSVSQSVILSVSESASQTFSSIKQPGVPALRSCGSSSLNRQCITDPVKPSDSQSSSGRSDTVGPVSALKFHVVSRMPCQSMGQSAIADSCSLFISMKLHSSTPQAAESASQSVGRSVRQAIRQADKQK